MLKPWEKSSMAPSFRFGVTSFLNTAGWVISGVSITITSAPLLASAALSSFQPSCSASLPDGPAGALAEYHVEAAIAQIERLRAPLAAVAQHRDALSSQRLRICVFFPEHFRHLFLLVAFF